MKVEASLRLGRRCPAARVVRDDEDGVLLVAQPRDRPQAILRAALAAGPVEQFGFKIAGLIDLYRRWRL